MTNTTTKSTGPERPAQAPSRNGVRATAENPKAWVETSLMSSLRRIGERGVPNHPGRAYWSPRSAAGARARARSYRLGAFAGQVEGPGPANRGDEGRCPGRRIPEASHEWKGRRGRGAHVRNAVVQANYLLHRQCSQH